MKTGSWRLWPLALLLACTDPRARPVPPLVDLSFAPSMTVTSPDTIIGSLYSFDEDGLHSARIQLRDDAGVIDTDSQVPLDATIEQTRPLSLVVPAGLPAGTRLTVVVTVRDFAAFQTTDSIAFQTQP